jgi:hypothetical protein
MEFCISNLPFVVNVIRGLSLCWYYAHTCAVQFPRVFFPLNWLGSSAITSQVTSLSTFTYSLSNTFLHTTIQLTNVKWNMDPWCSYMWLTKISLSSMCFIKGFSLIWNFLEQGYFLDAVNRSLKNWKWKCIKLEFRSVHNSSCLSSEPNTWLRHDSSRWNHTLQ